MIRIEFAVVLINIVQHAMRAGIVGMLQIKKTRFVEFVVIESHPLIEYQIGLEPIDDKIKRAVNIFQRILRGINRHNSHFILAERIFLDYEMTDSDAISFADAVCS